VQDEKGLRVGLVHNMPFDEINGLGKTAAELQQIGALVDDIPEPEQIEGKDAVMYYSPQTNSVYYEYVDHVPTPEKQLQQLKDQILAQQDAIAELTILLASSTN
jgi:hypothetical protein